MKKPNKKIKAYTIDSKDWLKGNIIVNIKIGDFVCPLHCRGISTNFFWPDYVDEYGRHKVLSSPLPEPFLEPVMLELRK